MKPGLTPCASVFHFTQSRWYGHTGQIAMFFSQRAVLRTRWSLAKPTGTLIHAVQLKLIPFNKYFCGGSHFPTLHCHHSNNTHNIETPCRSVLQRNGRDVHVNRIFPPNQIRWASCIRPVNSAVHIGSPIILLQRILLSSMIFLSSDQLSRLRYVLG